MNLRIETLKRDSDDGLIYTAPNSLKDIIWNINQVVDFPDHHSGSKVTLIKIDEKGAYFTYIRSFVYGNQGPVSKSDALIMTVRIDKGEVFLPWKIDKKKDRQIAKAYSSKKIKDLNDTQAEMLSGNYQWSCCNNHLRILRKMRKGRVKEPKLVEKYVSKEKLKKMKDLQKEIEQLQIDHNKKVYHKR